MRVGAAFYRANPRGFEISLMSSRTVVEGFFFHLALSLLVWVVIEDFPLGKVCKLHHELFTLPFAISDLYHICIYGIRDLSQQSLRISIIVSLQLKEVYTTHKPNKQTLQS